MQERIEGPGFRQSDWLVFSGWNRRYRIPIEIMRDIVLGKRKSYALCDDDNSSVINLTYTPSLSRLTIKPLIRGEVDFTMNFKVESIEYYNGKEIHLEELEILEKGRLQQLSVKAKMEYHKKLEEMLEKSKQNNPDANRYWKDLLGGGF